MAREKQEHRVLPPISANDYVQPNHVHTPASPKDRILDARLKRQALIHDDKQKQTMRPTQPGVERQYSANQLMQCVYVSLDRLDNLVSGSHEKIGDRTNFSQCYAYLEVGPLSSGSNLILFLAFEENIPLDMATIPLLCPFAQHSRTANKALRRMPNPGSCGGN